MKTATQKYLALMKEKVANKLNKKPEEIKDKDLQKLLNIASSTMSRYSTGQRQADDDVAYEIAHYVEVPPMQIIGEIKAEESKNEKAKKWWLEQSKKAVGAFGAVCLVSATLLATPNEAKANSFNSNKPQSIYYTNLSIRRNQKWLIYCFHTLLSVFTHKVRKNIYAII